MSLKIVKIKSVKMLLINSPTAMDVLYLIKFRDDGNVDKKFQPCILNRKTCFPHFVTDGRTDSQSYRVVSKQKKKQYRDVTKDYMI